MPNKRLIYTGSERAWEVIWDSINMDMQSHASDPELRKTVRNAYNRIYEFDLQEITKLLKRYRALHDLLSDMIEDGRLKKTDIPEDYRRLVDSLCKLAGLDGKLKPSKPLEQRIIRPALKRVRSNPMPLKA